MRFFQLGAVVLVSLWLVACGDDGASLTPGGSDDTASGEAADTGVHTTKADAGKHDASLVHAPDASNDTVDELDASEPSVPPHKADAGIGSDAAATADAGSSADASKPVVDAGKSDAGASTCDTLTYDSFGQAFLMSYCVNCHGPTLAQKNIKLDTLAGVVAKKSQVKSEVSGSSMPPFGSKAPTAAERKQFGQWIDCGPN